MEEGEEEGKRERGGKKRSEIGRIKKMKEEQEKDTNKE